MKIEKIPPDIKNIPILIGEIGKTAFASILVFGFVIGAIIAGAVVFLVMQ